jgi:hypothetical protein
MFIPNPTSAGRFPTVKKTHKAVLGALLLTERPLRPYPRGKRTVWTFDFAAPSGPAWNTAGPLYVPDEKLREMVSLGYVTLDEDGLAWLTNGGHSVARGTEADWYWYWKLYFDQHDGAQFDWVQYFKTGVLVVGRSARRRSSS